MRSRNNRKNIIIKNSAPFTDCISEINNTQIDNARDSKVVMPVLESPFKVKAYNFIKKGLQHMCFPVRFCKIFKNNFFKETS